jgi:putative N6-adenine-specific DNA methylase
MMRVVVPALLGLEAVVAEELVSLGHDPAAVETGNGRVAFQVAPGHLADAVARANLWLRSGERVLVELGRFPAPDFDALFDGTAALPWEDFIPSGAAFPVKGSTRASRLESLPACQSIIKKAVVERLRPRYGLPPGAALPEDEQAAVCRIQFTIVDDVASLMLDTTGEPLHKRGYRPVSTEAPLRETLAAAMILLLKWRPFSDEVLVDPFCGSGTLPVEAALIACGIAPGASRRFACERWPAVGADVFAAAREEAADFARPRIRTARDHAADGRRFVFGSDLDPAAVALTAKNASRAGVDGLVGLRAGDALALTPAALTDWTGSGRRLVLCNPPYGERLLDPTAAAAISRGIGQTFLDRGSAPVGSRVAVLSAVPDFERLAGAPADKRRKLYNGMLQCHLYQYFRWRRPAP